MVKLASTSASSSASIEFTSKISSNFSTYYVKIRNILPATDATSLLLTFSTDNGSTYLSTNYTWVFSSALSSNSQTITYNAADTSITIADTLSNDTTRDLNADIMLYDMNSGTYMSKIDTHCVSYNSDAHGKIIVGGGSNTGTTAITAIKFAMASGNIASGTIGLYGIQDGGFIY